MEGFETSLPNHLSSLTDEHDALNLSNPYTTVQSQLDSRSGLDSSLFTPEIDPVEELKVSQNEAITHEIEEFLVDIAGDFASFDPLTNPRPASDPLPTSEVANIHLSKALSLARTDLQDFVNDPERLADLEQALGKKWSSLRTKPLIESLVSGETSS